jgi:hypothetical protein
MKPINHEEAYSMDGACTNWAEEFFSRMCKMNERDKASLLCGAESRQAAHSSFLTPPVGVPLRVLSMAR